MKEKKSILDEAIADAKTVRSVAIENAKSKLLESFQPTLKSMLAKKVVEETEDEDEKEDEDEIEDTTIEIDGDDEEVEDGEKMKKEETEDDDEEKEVKEEDDDEEDLDVESIIKNIEKTIKEEDEEEEDEEVKEEVEDDDDEEIDIEIDDDEDEKDEIDIAVEEEEDDDDKEENEQLKKEVNELKKAYAILKEEVNESRLLSRKLKYVNEIYSKFNLTQNQKVNVLESFDNACNIKESKLVFETIVRSLYLGKKDIRTKGKLKEIASNITGTTKPDTKIINETTDLVSRFQKLAGIKIKTN